MAWVNKLLRSLFSTQKEEEVSWKEKYSFAQDEEVYEKDDLLSMAKLISEQEQWFMEQYAIVTLNTPQSHGVVLKSNEKADYEFFEHFLNFIRSQVKACKGYYNPISEVRHVECNESKKETIFVYLKPSPKTCSEGIKHDQKYGQISLSLVNNNSCNYSFKIQANYYSGHQYTEPIHLKNLLLDLSCKKN